MKNDKRFNQNNSWSIWIWFGIQWYRHDLLRRQWDPGTNEERFFVTHVESFCCGGNREISISVTSPLFVPVQLFSLSIHLSICTFLFLFYSYLSLNSYFPAATANEKKRNDKKSYIFIRVTFRYYCALRAISLQNCTLLVGEYLQTYRSGLKCPPSPSRLYLNKRRISYCVFI